MKKALSSRMAWPGLLIGFALGGFFDGILLHQILQWHHLLSSLDSDGWRDIRFQILADGMFHAAMYVVGVFGLWKLWRSRSNLANPASGQLLLSFVLAGFGLWHVIDAVLSHWVLGIHRVRMDSSQPLLWDLIWLLAFGITPLIAAYFMLRRSWQWRGNIVASWLGALVVAGAGIASIPPRNVSEVLVVFRSSTSPQQVFAAAKAADARVIWSDQSGQLWAFHLTSHSRTSAMYRHGAIFIGGSAFVAGCINWVRRG